MRALTRIALKAQLYEREAYFRESLADAQEVLGDALYPVLRRTALLVMKPDGIVSGKTGAVLDFLARHDFAVVAAERISFTPLLWRELWRYQLTIATLDRLAVNDVVMHGEALVLVLRHEGGLDVPAAVHLSVLKGPSDIALQRADALRRALGQPNRILSFVHVADEPADVVREFALFLGPAARGRALLALRSAPLPPHQLDEIAGAQGKVRELDPAGALVRAEAAVRGQGNAPASVLADLERMRRGERIAWRPFARALALHGIQLDRWDAAALGATFILYDEPGFTKQITAVDPQLWRDADQPS